MFEKNLIIKWLYRFQRWYLPLKKTNLDFQMNTCNCKPAPERHHRKCEVHWLRIYRYFTSG